MNAEAVFRGLRNFPVVFPILPLPPRLVEASSPVRGVRARRRRAKEKSLPSLRVNPILGEPLGHARIETTSRYAHFARDSVREAAERVAESIATDILDEDRI